MMTAALTTHGHRWTVHWWWHTWRDTGYILGWDGADGDEDVTRYGGIQRLVYTRLPWTHAQVSPAAYATWLETR
jgi:hypothetical protein